MNELSLVLLGAGLALISTLLIERWKLVRAGRVAALILLKELELHRVRLNLITKAEEYDNTEYQMKFPSHAWEAQGTPFLTAAAKRESFPVLDWYGTLTVLGFELARFVGTSGPQSTGPDRGALKEMLRAAVAASERVAARRLLIPGRGPAEGPPPD